MWVRHLPPGQEGEAQHPGLLIAKAKAGQSAAERPIFVWRIFPRDVWTFTFCQLLGFPH